MKALVRQTTADHRRLRLSVPVAHCSTPSSRGPLVHVQPAVAQRCLVPEVGVEPTRF